MQTVELPDQATVSLKTLGLNDILQYRKYEPPEITQYGYLPPGRWPIGVFTKLRHCFQLRNGTHSDSRHALMMFAAMFPCPLGSPAILNAPSPLTLMALTESNTFLTSTTSVPGNAAVTPESQQHPLKGSGWTLSYSPETSESLGFLCFCARQIIYKQN